MMDGGDIPTRVTELLRSRILHGSSRVLDLDRPLSDQGIDSLGIVEFMATVESSFDVELPEAFWNRSGLRLSDVIAHLQAGNPR
ncbi:MAG TPA: acyl carrier protein [Gemmatimonadales bacterium]|nr:acyl carrier protein [Gemmatimonadales bacterium]